MAAFTQNMLVVGKKILVVVLILNKNFTNVTFLFKEGNIFLCKDLMQEREVKF